MTDEYVKKKLSRRHSVISGKRVQRDLYSAFLLMNSDGTLEHTDRKLCFETYSNFLVNHDRCIEELMTGSHKLLSSFGIRRAM